MMIPAKYHQLVFSIILSGLMSLIVSGIATFRTVGLIEDFAILWVTNWLPSWSVACPTLLVLAPVTRRLVSKLVRAES